MNKLNIGILVVVVLVVIVAFAMKDDGSKLTSREVALTCTTDMATKFHIHPMLEIYLLGERQPIPANIGIQPTCMTSLHTHTPDGEIHVESPYKKDFTLGDFFAVWQQPFSKDAILDRTTDAEHTISVLVNGEPVDTYEHTILRDKDVIVIRYEQNT